LGGDLESSVKVAGAVSNLIENLVDLLGLLAGQVERTGQSSNVRDQVSHQDVQVTLGGRVLIGQVL